jgi:predicted TIM-barrel fold metal-dependent hydrolase
MGYVDCDTHIVECEQTWDYFDPEERQFRPIVNGGYWTVEDHVVSWPGPMTKQWKDVVFPGLDLVDIDARLRYMDDFGVDVQILYTSWWLLYPTWSPAAEAALYRSYNRWMAERTSGARGRLTWALMLPTRTMERAFAEMAFGKEHGAASVFLLGQNHGMSLADPSMFPLYERAQDLDLAITVHVGNDFRVNRRDPGNAFHMGLMILPGAFQAVLWAGIAKRFPRLRWAFVEGGASWVKYVLHQTFRADANGAYRSFKDWRASASDALAGAQLYVAAQVDDDLPEVIELLGSERVIYGTDYGHLDVGSDPDGLHVMETRSHLDPTLIRKLLNENGRRLLGVDPSFQPAPKATVFNLPPERIAAGLPAPDRPGWEATQRPEDAATLA